MDTTIQALIGMAITLDLWRALHDVWSTSLLSPVECNLGRWQHGDTFPHCTEAQRGRAGWLRSPSWLQREPGLKKLHPCPALWFWALVLLPQHRHHVAFHPLLLREHLSHFSPLNAQSNRDTSYISLCDCWNMTPASLSLCPPICQTDGSPLPQWAAGDGRVPYRMRITHY